MCYVGCVSGGGGGGGGRRGAIGVDKVGGKVGGKVREGWSGVG